MKRLWIAVLLVTTCLLSGAAGFWWGVREGSVFRGVTERFSRGALATYHARALQAGHLSPVKIIAELDVDAGLLFGYEILNQRWFRVLRVLDGYDLDTEFERQATLLAEYRRDTPSERKSGTYERLADEKKEHAEQYRAMAAATREEADKINWMVERYGSRNR